VRETTGGREGTMVGSKGRVVELVEEEMEEGKERSSR
jgi:hypothetical protein